MAAARRFFERAIDLHDVRGKITIDKSSANTAGIDAPIEDSGAGIELRQSKYLNNLVEQGHRAVKRRVRPMPGFKSFWSATRIIAGVETMDMIKKGQLACPKGQAMSVADRFCRLAFSSHSAIAVFARLHFLIATAPARDGPSSHIPHAQPPVARDLPRHGVRADRSGRAVVVENSRRRQDRAAPEGPPFQRRNPGDRKHTGSSTAGRLIMPTDPHTPLLTIARFPPQS